MPMKQKGKSLKKILDSFLKKDKFDIWYLDEVLFKQYGSSCRMWISSTIKNPILLHNPTSKKVGYFGAVRSDGKFVFSQEEGKFNGETFFSFLKKLAAISRSRGRKIIVILDNARYHHAKLHKDWRKEMESKGFFLRFLPPYSPDLNPIERVWKLIRRLKLHNRFFKTISEVINSVESLCKKWIRPNQTLKQLCAVT